MLILLPLQSFCKKKSCSGRYFYPARTCSMEKCAPDPGNRPLPRSFAAYCPAEKTARTVMPLRSFAAARRSKMRTGAGRKKTAALSAGAHKEVFCQNMYGICQSRWRQRTHRLYGQFYCLCRGADQDMWFCL